MYLVIASMSLESFFKGSAAAKVLDVMWEYQDLEISLTDIADEAGIHYTTLMELLPVLENTGVIRMVRRVGNAKMYQIDKDSEVAKRLVAFLNAVNIRIAERAASEQKAAYP